MWMTNLLLLLSLLGGPLTALTPPRIIYGGWTPILPGHPFYFGSVGRRNVEHHYHHHQNHLRNAHFSEPPTHNVEHHHEHHVEFVDPVGQLKHYSPIKEEGMYLQNSPKTYHPTQQSYDGRTPVKHQTYNQKPEEGNYAHFTPPLAKEKQGSSGNNQHGRDIYNYYPPKSAYEEPYVQDKGQHISSGHKTNKNIFSYYPPQSSYEGPKIPQLDPDYKPVYFEVPRKPLDVYENPRGHILPLLKDGKPFSIHDLASLRNGVGEKTYLKITPLGSVDPSVLKHIGELNLDQIHQYGGAIKDEKFPVVKDSSGGTPKIPVFKYSSPNYPIIKESLSQYPTPGQYVPLTYGKHNSAVTKLNYGIGADLPYKIQEPTIYNTANTYRGTDFPLVGNIQSLKRPLNPIETKKYRNNPKITNYNGLTFLSPITTTAIDPSNLDVYSKAKYISPAKTLVKPFEIGKTMLPPVTVLGKHFANPTKYYLRSQYPSVRPFYPRTALPRGPLFSYRPLQNNLLHLPLKTAPQFLHKDVKLQTLYRNPSVVTNIHGSPALVDREVAILQVPVKSSPPQNYDYPSEKDYLYYTASTPESTQVFENLNNGSVPYVTLGKNAPQQYENDDKRNSAYAQEPQDNNLSDPQQQDEYRYIFVSSSGVLTDPHPGQAVPETTKKQFFHAYYAPADHTPPSGYVKMSVQEFKNLFKNAEIRYVDKDPTTLPASQDHYHAS